MKNAAPQVLAAMSGGVDSAVTALLLMEQGFDVTGVTMELFDACDVASKGEIGCLKGATDSKDAIDSTACSPNDVGDARDVCRRLGIPHRMFDFKNRFASDVIDPFCTSYLNGQTPNPCIECNRRLKLAGLQQKRRELGADYVATGHYVRRARDPETGHWRLLRAADDTKDQSYVLYHLTQDDLEHMLFPLGDLTKAQVRERARQHGFANADKRESQDICFVPDGDYVAFIRRYRGEGADALFEAGDIVNMEGQRLGKHRGLVRYTIGQRRGIGIAGEQPLYVIAKDVKQNRLVVAPHDELAIHTVHLRDVNVISGDTSPRTCSVEAKTAYRQRPAAAELCLAGDGTATLHFAESQTRPAAGQAAVCYIGDEVICGGTIC